MNLKELVGNHWLSGVDVNTYGNDGSISFILDNIIYTVIEDPIDGYRSCIGEILIGKIEVKNTFKKVKVFCSINYDEDMLTMIDVKTGKTIIEVGTEYSDSYYPSFVNYWKPDNLSLNKD